MRPHVTKVSVTCPHCGVIFHQYASARQRFCSRACAYAGRRAAAKTRFWSKVKKTASCWLWTDHITRGYGYVGYEYATWRAHRLAYVFTYGPIPSGALVLHKCDNRACVRPDHLYLGNAKDNTRDMMLRGRHSRGKRQIVASTIVDQIRSEYAAGNITHRQLAHRFHLGRTTIARILTHGHPYE